MNATKTGRILIIALAYALPGCTPVDRPDGPGDGAADDSATGGASQEDSQFDTLGITFVDAPCQVPNSLGPPANIRIQNGNIEVNRQPVLVCRGQQMEWTREASSVESWEVTWTSPGTSPLYPQGPVRSGPNGTGGGLAVAIGVFKYDIRAVTPSGDTLRIDPDVVILPGTFKMISP